MKTKMNVKCGFRAQLQLVYPSVSCVRSSLEGYAGGGSLPYRSATAVRQLYLTTMMYE
jgi:hypothetical protein